MTMADVRPIALILLLGSLVMWAGFRLGRYQTMRSIGALRATKQEKMEQMLREELTPTVRNQLLEDEREGVRNILEAREREGMSALMKQRLFNASAAFGMRESYKRGKRDGKEQMMDEITNETLGARNWAHGQYPFARPRRARSPKSRHVHAYAYPGASDIGGEDLGDDQRHADL